MADKDKKTTFTKDGLVSGIYNSFKDPLLGKGPDRTVATNAGATTLAGKNPVDSSRVRNTGFTRATNEFLKGYARTGDGEIIYSELDDNPAYTREFNLAGYNLDAALASTGLTWNRLTHRYLNFETINRNRIVNTNDMTHFGRTYIFFTKPDLYLFMEDGSINPSIIQNCPDLATKILNNPSAAAQLQSIPSAEPVTAPDKGFMHLLSNMCADASFPDIVLSQRQAAANKREQGLKYAGDFVQSLHNNEMQISFYDTKRRDVSTVMEIWTEYMEGISQGRIYKKLKYRDRNILDYAVSIYIFVMDEINNIVQFGCLVGAYPVAQDTTLLRHKGGENLTVRDFQGPFSYKFHTTHTMKPNSQSVIEMFNYASGYTSIVSKFGKEILSAPNQKVNSFAGSFESLVPNKSYTGAGANDYIARRHSKSTNSIKYIMHQSINPYGRSAQGYIPNRMPDGLKGYHHQLTITEYWPQYVGAVRRVHSDGVTGYALMFFSSMKHLGTSPQTMWNIIDPNKHNPKLLFNALEYTNRFSGYYMNVINAAAADNNTYNIFDSKITHNDISTGPSGKLYAGPDKDEHSGSPNKIISGEKYATVIANV